MKDYRRSLTKISEKDYFLDSIDINFSERIIMIDSEITDETAAEIRSAVLILSGKSDADITLYINSPGGSVTAGLSIYDTLKMCGCDIVTIASGMAASMGAFLVGAAGTKGKRYAHPNATIMIHQPLGGTRGQATEIRIQAEQIIKVRELLNSIMAKACGKDIETLNRDTERDNYLNAEEALEYGLIDKIGDPILKWEE